jgi:hypothetical protein
MGLRTSCNALGLVQFELHLVGSYTDYKLVIDFSVSFPYHRLA